MERPTQRSPERLKTKNFWNIPTLKLGLCLGIDPRGCIPGSQGNSLGFVHPGPAFIWEWVVKREIFGHKSEIFGHKKWQFWSQKVTFLVTKSVPGSGQGSNPAWGIPKLPELPKDTWAGFSSWKIPIPLQLCLKQIWGRGGSLHIPIPSWFLGCHDNIFPFPAAISTLSPENGWEEEREENSPPWGLPGITPWEFPHVPKSQNSRFLSCFEVVFIPVLEQGGIWESWALPAQHRGFFGGSSHPLGKIWIWVWETPRDGEWPPRSSPAISPLLYFWFFSASLKDFLSGAGRVCMSLVICLHFRRFCAIINLHLFVFII